MIDFVPETEQWRVEFSAGNILEHKSLKAVMTAIREHEKKEKTTTKPFWAILSTFDGDKRVYITNINERSQRLYYKTSEKATKVYDTGIRWGTDVFLDTDASREALAKMKEAEKKAHDAEEERGKIETKLERLELSSSTIANKLGKYE